MKKIVVLIGSRRMNGNTVNFVKNILNRLPDENFEVEYIFPQQYKIAPCMGCGSCFKKLKCISNDDLPLLQEKILKSDMLVVASPVYLHYMTADLKLIFEKCAWWAHTFRLEGKPTVVMSTCDSNGHKTVIEAISQIITYMGGNVIATCNGSQYPDRLNNEVWLDSVSEEIIARIIKYSSIPNQSNSHLEKLFISTRDIMKLSVEHNIKTENQELEYWIETGMINCESFKSYLAYKSNKKLVC